MAFAKTELFVRKQPGGMYAVVNEALSTGGVFFVNSVTGSNTVNNGRNPDAPFASLDYALGQATTGAGDRFFLMPGHVETLTAAGSSLGNGGVFCGATLSNNVSIIGLGNGRYRPTFNYTTAAAASFNVTAAGVTIRNCVFTPTGVSAVTAAMNITGADFTMEDCEMQISTGANACVLGILTAATAARMRIRRCYFIGPALSTQTCTAAIKHEVGINYEIRDCFFIGKLTNAILNATAILGGLIDNNKFHVYTGTATTSMHASSTGVISNNTMVVASGGTPCIGTIMSYVNNKYTTEGIGVNAGTALTF